MRPVVLLGLALLVVPLTGCLTIGDPGLEVRATTYDSMAAFTVEDVTMTFEYRDLQIFVNGAGFQHGPRMDTGNHWYAVEAKERPDQPIDLGDRIWLPGAGRLDVKFTHVPTNTVVHRMELLLQDQTPPPPPELRSPQEAGTVSATDPSFAWDRVDDASGVSYVLEVWAATGEDGGDLLGGGEAGETVHQQIRGLQVTDLSPGDRLVLVPGVSYDWRVKAVDGRGQEGPWSSTWSFGVT